VYGSQGLHHGYFSEGEKIISRAKRAKNFLVGCTPHFWNCGLSGAENSKNIIITTLIKKTSIKGIYDKTLMK